MFIDENSDLSGLNCEWDSDLTITVNVTLTRLCDINNINKIDVTLTRFAMARSLDYLLHRGQGQTKSVRVTRVEPQGSEWGPFAI